MRVCRPLVWLALLALLLVTVLPSASAETSLSCGKKCKCVDEAPKAVGACDVKVNMCDCTKKKMGFKCDAFASGLKGHTEKAKSADECRSASMFALFSQLGAEDHCNCQAGAIPLGTCNLKYSACFYFDSQEALAAGKSLFKATVHGPEGTSSVEVGDKVSGEDAISSAAQQLLAKFPQIMTQCGTAMLTMEGIPLLPVPNAPTNQILLA